MAKGGDASSSRSRGCPSSRSASSPTPRGARPGRRSARRPARGVGPPRLDAGRARGARQTARACARMVGDLHALQGAGRARARAERDAAPHDRAADDHRVGARAAVPRLDRGTEGHRPGPPRLRPRPDPRFPASPPPGSTSPRSTWSRTPSSRRRRTRRRTARAASPWPAARATRYASASSPRSSRATSAPIRCLTRTASRSRSASGASPPTRTSAARWTAANRPSGSGRKLLSRAGLPNGDDVERSLHKQRRSLERLRRLTEIYGPYTELDCAFDDRETRALATGWTRRTDAPPVRHRRDRLGELHGRCRTSRHCAGWCPSPGRRAASRRASGRRSWPRAPRRSRSSTSRASCSTRPSCTPTRGCAARTCRTPPRAVAPRARGEGEHVPRQGPRVARGVQPRLLPALREPPGAGAA